MVTKTKRLFAASFPLGKGNRSGCERGRWWPSFFFLRHFAQKQHKTFKSDSKCKIKLFEEFENNDSNMFSRRAALSALPLCARSSLAPVSNKKGQMFVDLFESSHFGFSKTSEIWNCIFRRCSKTTILTCPLYVRPSLPFRWVLWTHLRLFPNKNDQILHLVKLMSHFGFSKTSASCILKI